MLKFLGMPPKKEQMNRASACASASASNSVNGHGKGASHAKEVSSIRNASGNVNSKAGG